MGHTNFYATCSGCITLPSQRTLRDYTHYIKSTVGFSDEVDLQLAGAAKLNASEEFKKCVIMLMILKRS